MKSKRNNFSLLALKCLDLARWYEKEVTKEGIRAALCSLSKDLELNLNLSDTYLPKKQKQKGEVPDTLIREMIKEIDGTIDIPELVDFVKDKELAKPKRRLSAALEILGRNLVEDAATGKLDPVIGRENDLDRLIRCLGRRKKNNAMIIGDSGTGKTALVEKLAHAIATDCVPEHLAGTPIYSIDVVELAGMKQAKTANLLAEIEKSDVVMFLDEIHLLMDQRFFDLSQTLKPMLVRGNFRCIGATTRGEFVRHFSDDEAFRRRFELIDIKEVSYEDAVNIVRGILPLYEQHHKVKITEEVVKSIVNFSQRYLKGKMPDKCLDLLERVCADTDSSRSVMKIEPGSLIIDIYNGKEKEKSKELTLFDVKKATERLTGIESIADFTYEELRKNIQLQVVGHEKELDEIISHIVKSNNVFRTTGCLASFLFIGPEGSGREHVTRSLCKTLYGSEDPLLVIDMAYYETPHNITRLLGAPPGYVGFDPGGGIIAKFTRSHPTGIIYLQNMGRQESAVTTIFKTAIEVGKIHDAAGYEIDMRNYIIIGSCNTEENKVVGYSKGNHTALPVIKFIRPQIVFEKLGQDKLEDLGESYLNRNIASLSTKGLQVFVHENVLPFLVQGIKDATALITMINTSILDKIDYTDKCVGFKVKKNIIVKESR